MDDLTILINSCYAYSDMWENTISLFKANWDDNSEIVLLSDGSDTEFNYKLKCVKSYLGEMSERIAKALKDIKTKYVFLTFDDYYLIKKADIKFIKDVVKFMEENNISYCGTAFNIRNGKRKKCGDIKYIDSKLTEPYEINLYPSIWNREDLISCLNENNDIWTTEPSLTKQLKSNNKKAMILLNKHVYPFLDVVRKGKYSYSLLRCQNCMVGGFPKRRQIQNRSSNKKIL